MTGKRTVKKTKYEKNQDICKTYTPQLVVTIKYKTRTPKMLFSSQEMLSQSIPNPISTHIPSTYFAICKRL